VAESGRGRRKLVQRAVHPEATAENAEPVNLAAGGNPGGRKTVPLCYRFFFLRMRGRRKRRSVVMTTANGTFWHFLAFCGLQSEVKKTA
jgi:hypothetical protein